MNLIAAIPCSSEVADMHIKTCRFFYVDIRDPKLGIHACVTNILVIELSAPICGFLIATQKPIDTLNWVCYPCFLYLNVLV